MKINSLINKASEINGIGSMTITIPIGLKKDSTDMVIKVASLINVGYGWTYEKMVQKRESDQPSSFKAKSPAWWRWSVAPVTMEKISDPKIKYLRYYMIKNTKTENSYFVNGKEVTKESLLKRDDLLSASRKKLESDWTEYIGDLKESQKTDPDKYPVVTRMVTLENIHCLKVSGMEFSR